MANVKGVWAGSALPFDKCPLIQNTLSRDRLHYLFRFSPANNKHTSFCSMACLFKGLVLRPKLRSSFLRNSCSTPLNDDVCDVDCQNVNRLVDNVSLSSSIDSHVRRSYLQNVQQHQAYIDHYSVVKVIGKGNFGIVKLAKHQPTGTMVCKSNNIYTQ